MSEWHFYIAHAEPDGERATQLAEALARHRWRVYVPGVSADAGTDRQAADESALRAAPICVVLVSPQSQADASLRATVTTALEYRKADPHERRVVPVLLDGLKPSALREYLGLGNVTPLQGATAAAADSMAGVAAELGDLARRVKVDDPTAEADRVRVAIVAVEEELGTASRQAFDAIDHIGRVSVERLDAVQAETTGLLARFDFVVGLVGAHLGQPGLFLSLLEREHGALLRRKDLDVTVIARNERNDLLDLHQRIDERSCFTNAEGAARLAHARVVTWLEQRFPTPPGGQALIETWERDYLKSKLTEWASVRYAPLAVKGGERELRREALYVSLYAAPQTWCYVGKGGGLVVKSPQQERAAQPNPKSPRADENAGERQPPSSDDSDGRPFLEAALSHPDLKALVLEGEGGSGKSVLLQHVAHVLAAKHLGLPAPEHHLDFGALHAGAPLLRIPVLLEARRIAQEIHAHGAERALREAVTAVFGGVDVLGPTTVLEGLNRGRYLLLVDALDEVPGVAMREKVLHALASQAALGGPLRLVLTTRPAAYTGVVVPAPLRVLPLAPMNKSDARRLIDRWTHAQGRSGDYRKKLLRAVSGVRRTHGINNVLENPLLLTCLLLVYEQHRRLPNSTAELYERMVEVLCLSKATRERDAGDRPALSDQDRREALEWIGLGLQEHGGTARPLPAVVVDLCQQRPDLSPTPGDGEELVKRLALETALVRVEVTRAKSGAEVRVVKPWHRSFQEYLAARRLASGPASVKAKTRGLLLARQGGSARVVDPAWAGVLRFLAGVHGRADPKNARRYVQTLCAAVSGAGGERDELRRREGYVLGLALAAMSEYEQYFRGHALKAALPREAIEAFEARGDKWPWRDRVSMLDALGRLPGGDPRLRRDPWVKVPAGRFVMGGDDGAHNSAPRHEVEVGEFLVRRWPVTVGEYREFVDAGGCSDSRLWDEPPKEREPEGWRAQLRHLNRPVVGVSWWEVRAFCRWATSAGWAPEGFVVTLPTEEEWEYVARGSEGRFYAWGNEPPGEGDVARAGYGGYTRGDVPESAMPVGAFPTGHSPEGLWDVAGNVWEWTACRFRENAEDWRQGDTSCHQDDIDCHFDDNESRQDDKRGDKATPLSRPKSLSAAPRVVRGGSWGYDPGNLRAASRYGLGPGGRDDNLGFRVVCRGSRQHIDP